MIYILLTFSILIIQYSTLSADIRPKALSPAKNCELWVGTANGNDPTVQIELSLCFQRNKEAYGVLQWSSERSGWSKRAVKGYKDEDKSLIILRDDSFMEYKPNKGWKFCLIDEYNLSVSKNILAGTYISKACQDHARLSLILKSTTLR